VGLVQELSEIMDNRGEVDAILIDFEKAFDVVPHVGLVEKVRKLEIDGRVVRWIQEWLTGRTQRVRVGDKYSKDIEVTSGVPQGSVLGPLLFIIFINDIIGDNNECRVRLFADDCIAYLEIKNQGDQVKLQQYLNDIEKWVHLNKMKLNNNKSQLIKFTNKKESSCNFFQYKLNNEELKYTKSCKYLGVTLTSNLHWGEHVNNVVKSGQKSLNFVMRNLRGTTPKVREKAYISMVRPILEYASSAWDPHSQENIGAIEKVQRRAARKVLNRYGPRESPTEMIKAMGWETLEGRRAMCKVRNMFKAITGYTAWNGITQRLVKATHSGRMDHSCKLQHRGSNTNIGKYSFLSTATQLWNKLPGCVVKPWPENVNTLKLRLKNVNQMN
jgi:hypothetical protein